MLRVVPLDGTEIKAPQAQASLAPAAEALRVAGFWVETKVLRDMVADAIVRVSAEWDADIIVLGWHGRTTLKRYLFGGVTAR